MANLKKAAKKKSPQKFFQAVREEVEASLTVQTFQLSVTVLAALLRDEELGKIEISREGVIRQLKSVIKREKAYLDSKRK